MSLDDSIDQFLNGTPFAVIGASRNRDKYGNKVLRCYLQNDHRVFAINPNADEVEGMPAHADLASLPEPVHGISIITPPSVTELIVEQAVSLGIQNIWMQPGADSPTAIATARQASLNLISGTACLLVVLGFSDQ
ncbi:MAG: CoA-binding protein [Planctomycetes bacterium]|nr:CoA-binding protein [Planctomycetota bacterium]